jgi:hypothetical protein
MGWLGRTANLLPHAVTGKEPWSELNIERTFLTLTVPAVQYAGP